MRSVRFGSIWIGSTLTQVLLNCVGLHGHGTTLGQYSEPTCYRIGESIQGGSSRSHINAILIGTNFVPVPNDPVSCKRSLSQIDIKICQELKFMEVLKVIGGFFLKWRIGLKHVQYCILVTNCWPDLQ